MNNSFDIDRIPENILHNSVYEALSDRGIEKVHGGYKFRCPLCGDSKKNKNLKRGYVTYKDNRWLYTCHNECGITNYISFLKKYNEGVYKKVIFHGFSKKYNKKEDFKKKSETNFKSKEYKFKDGELLSIYNSHYLSKKALEYCKSRHIREEAYSKWYVCIKDDKFLDRDDKGNLIYNEKGYPKGNEYRNRLIIPYYKFGGKWTQFDARDLTNNSLLRYRNLEFADRELYNIDFLDVKKPFFLLEGSIDSTFIRNSIAFGGTQHLQVFLEKYPELLEYRHNGCCILDNDNAGYDELPKVINLGFNWFNWSTIKPSREYEFDEKGEKRIIKDINNLVMYTNLVKRDKENYITFDSLKKYIERSEGGLIKSTMLYGNRKKLKLEKIKKFYESRKSKNKINALNW